MIPAEVHTWRLLLLTTTAKIDRWRHRQLINVSFHPMTSQPSLSQSPPSALQSSSYTYYNAIQKFCNAHNICHLTESETRAVAGGTWQIKDFKIKGSSKIYCFEIKNIIWKNRLMVNCGYSEDIAFQICGAAWLKAFHTVSVSYIHILYMDADKRNKLTDKRTAQSWG